MSAASQAVAPHVARHSFAPRVDLIANVEQAFRRSHETTPREADERLTVTVGAIPDALRGTYYRNGPGRLERGGVAYGHLFDGDGMVASIAFDERGARFRNRFVRTAGYCEEQEHGAVRLRGFGTDRPGGFSRNALRMRFKNAANTSVIHHAGRLLALWEGGLPHALDAETLSTLGPVDFDGRLLARQSIEALLIGRELPFCAHPKVDPESGELFAFGTRPGTRPRLMIYRIAPDGRMDDPRCIDLPALSFVHDFALTREHFVFFLAPVAFRIGRALSGLATPAESLTAGAGPARVLLVPRAPNRRRRPVWLDAPPGFIFHIAHAYADHDDALVVDAVRYDRFPRVGNPLVDDGWMRALPTPHLARFRISPSRERIELEHETAIGVELPTVSPTVGLGPHRWIYSVASGTRGPPGHLTAIARHDRATGQHQIVDFAPDLPSEPCFVPRAAGADEGDGFLVTTVYRAAHHRSDLVVLDATTLTVLACAPLPIHLAPGFHGHWVAASHA